MELQYEIRAQMKLGYFMICTLHSAHSLLPWLQLAFQDEALDGKMKLVQEVVRTVRSMRQDYLPPKARPEGKEGQWCTR